MFEIDPDTKIITVTSEMATAQLMSELQKMWTKFMYLPFPIRQENKEYQLTHGWRFENLSSYLNIFPRIKPCDIPELPNAPEKYLLHEPVKLKYPYTIETLLHSLKKEIPNRSARLDVIDGKIHIVMDGAWPNYKFDNEIQNYKKDVNKLVELKKYKNMIEKYERKIA